MLNNMHFNKLFGIALSLCSAVHADINNSGVTAPPSKEKAAAALANIAVPFEENRGQVDAKVAFQSRILEEVML